MTLIRRALIRHPSGRRLDLLDPQPDAWTDEDLATGLSRTFRWGGHSIWPMPLPVAQHALTVLALYRRLASRPVTAIEALREVLHDVEEALIGGFDPISPVKPILGEAFEALSKNLQRVAFLRYGVPYWTDGEYRLHKSADNLAGASEAVHVAGWSAEEMHDLLNIALKPLTDDPLAEIYDCRPWEPWTPTVAAERFHEELTKQSRAAALCSVSNNQTCELIAK